mmetsp:Transcript_3917/g.12018  ORF Transcript_3917/g.12018 Transcript_3917/m.12018 type:complete len:203 (-) Transcript_3917:965-1573(-)
MGAERGEAGRVLGGHVHDRILPGDSSEAQVRRRAASAVPVRARRGQDDQVPPRRDGRLLAAEVSRLVHGARDGLRHADVVVRRLGASPALRDAGQGQIPVAVQPERRAPRPRLHRARAVHPLRARRRRARLGSAAARRREAPERMVPGGRRRLPGQGRLLPDAGHPRRRRRFRLPARPDRRALLVSGRAIGAREPPPPRRLL